VRTSNQVAETIENENAIFSAFVNRSYWKLHQYALSLLPPSAADADDDLVQEAYSRILESMRRGSPVRGYLEYRNQHGPDLIDMTRYMRVVIKHVFLDMIRRDRSTAISSLDEQLEWTDEPLDTQDLDEYSNVERVVLHQEATAELSAYIDRLPKRMQSIMKLKLNGFSSREIAENLSVSPATVRVSAMRATRLLRNMMTEKDSPSSLSRSQHNHDNSYNASPAMVTSIARLSDPYQMVVALRAIAR
jgi:RNA polymerase sigma factor (sigma-70 family)